MKTLKAVILLCFAIVLFSSIVQGQDRYQATWESLSKYKTPDWFRDARFGIYS
ncbi:MAG TPA: alpha-L-fucosidase [Mucilaginibacter sp.]